MDRDRVRQIVLAAAGDRRGVADVRFWESLSQTVEIHDPDVLELLHRGDTVAIDALRRQLAMRVGGL